MMKIIDKIKNHHHGDHGSGAHAEQKPSKPSGPRLHPDLLALYDISEKVLGVGTFATVKEIRCKETGRKFALKIILRKTLQGKGAMLETEISVLSKVRHPNCVSLLEMFETEDAVYLVTDLAEGGELFEQLLQKGYYTEGDAARLVRDVLLGVEYLHSMDIVHRDLKPENLLFKDKSANATLMITDFGLSKVLTGDNHVLMTACGTPGYVAPEVLQQTGHGKPVDMWSIGVIAYTLLVGFMPFYGEDQGALFESIISGEYEYEEEYWSDISPLAKAFIDSLLVTEPEERPTASRALDHPWFRAVLEHDMITPVSPADSVNLLPGFRKNFNARRMFKKAVRAVGILRKINGTGSASSFDSSASLSSSERASGEFGDEARANSALAAAAAAAATAETTGTTSRSRPHSLSGALSFHDVVQAASLVHKGLAGVSEHDDGDVTDAMNNLTVKDR
ncbi:hypothetical protein DFQ27_008857 [Actinomortierella ambigua]|uniref:Protein kinase domain-containing protein n=1 Tax=Actinomortierella ambigua TaxID=1343610 RepID=A0A9P6PQF3_9FUNG|nr:hypothetical protein DFQ27_008857 [Actinomortierella ambigua]